MASTLRQVFGETQVHAIQRVPLPYGVFLALSSLAASWGTRHPSAVGSFASGASGHSPVRWGQELPSVAGREDQPGNTGRGHGARPPAVIKQANLDTRG